MDAVKARFQVRKSNGKAAALFAQVMQRDAQGHVKHVLVPGHEGKRYQVLFHYLTGSVIELECLLDLGANGTEICQGSTKTVCYHEMAALMVAAKDKGKAVSVCTSEQDAKRVAQLGGKAFEVISRHNDSTRKVWIVVK